MDFEKILEIQRRHKVIWDAYAKSDKKDFADYWEKMEALSKEYFKEKFGNRRQLSR